MKKNFALLIIVCLIAFTFSACTSGSTSADGTSGSEKAAGGLRIVTTIFPEYDWVRNILGENPAGAETVMLLDTGVDLHSYQPTADDIVKISTADLFIYVGGESDDWVADVLKEKTGGDLRTVNLLEALGSAVKEEEGVEGMEEEEEEHGEEEEEEGPEYDEHVWLSLKNTSILCQKIADAIIEIDPDNASVYQKNVDAYLEKLSGLDQKYEAAVKNAGVKTLLFGDRFPFRYLTDDYGLDYFAAFKGCSAETEASFQTIVFLAGKADELGLHTVLKIEGSKHNIAETIVQNTEKKDQKILVLNSLQGTTAKDVREGADYLRIMEENLEVLTEALR